MTPINFEIDRAKGIVRSRGHGVLTDKELAAFAHQLFAAPDPPSPYRGLCDLTQVTEFEGSVGGIRQMAALARSTPARAPGGRLAFVTSTTSVYGLSRLYQTLSESPGFEIRIFDNDEAAALRWLGE